MPTLKYGDLYISHESDMHHEICKVFTDAKLTNKIHDFVMLDVNGNCPYPVDIDKAIKRRIDKWLDSNIENDDVEHCKIITLCESIAKKDDELRDLFTELSNIIESRESRGASTIFNEKYEIKSADLEKCKKYLDEIKKIVFV